MAENGKMGIARNGGNTEKMDNREEMGVVAEVMLTHPTPHIPRTDSGNSEENMPTTSDIVFIEG